MGSWQVHPDQHLMPTEMERNCLRKEAQGERFRVAGYDGHCDEDCFFLKCQGLKRQPYVFKKRLFLDEATAGQML